MMLRPAQGTRFHDPLLHRGRRSTKLKVFARAFAGLILAVILSLPAAGAAANSEYQVKAAFIYNFMKFVEWPSEASSSPGTICLGVLGTDPFGDALDVVTGKSVKGRRVVVVRVQSVEAAKDCHVLFICASEKRRVPQILRTVQNLRILTIADHDGFCEAGGMINLVSIKNRVGFEVNVAAVSRAKLRISSQLLKLARSVIE